MVSGFSITSLTFAAVGVAALVAYVVSRRTREIGVRVALGGQRHHLFALILREPTTLNC